MCPQVYSEFKEYDKNPNSKYLRSWNLPPKPDLAITFWAILLVICFEDFILIFYIFVPNTTIEGTMKKIIQFKQHFATTFRCLTKKIMVLVYWSTFSHILDRACSPHTKIDTFYDDNGVCTQNIGTILGLIINITLGRPMWSLKESENDTLTSLKCCSSTPIPEMAIFVIYSC